MQLVTKRYNKIRSSRGDTNPKGLTEKNISFCYYALCAGAILKWMGVLLLRGGFPIEDIRIREG